MTGSIPGIAASTSETFEFGGRPNSVEAPEKSLASDVTCAGTSMPMMTSQSAMAPLMSFFGSAGRVSAIILLPAVELAVDGPALAGAVFGLFLARHHGDAQSGLGAFDGETKLVARRKTSVA